MHTLELGNCSAVLAAPYQVLLHWIVSRRCRFTLLLIGSRKKKDKWKSQHLNLHELFSICPSTPALHMSPPEQALGMVLEVLEPRIFGCHKHPASTRGWAIRSEGSGKWDICFVWISAPPRSFRPVIFWEHAIMTTSVILSYINILQYLK